jgi:two-component sensor histidine kinase
VVKDPVTFKITMNELIGRVRGLSTVHSMLSAAEWSPLRLSDLVTQVVRGSLQAMPRDKHLSMTVSPSPVHVTSDQAHNLALVINELTTNAVKYAVGERNTVAITVQIDLDDGDAPSVCLEFRDDGPGYPEDVLRLERCNVGFDLIQSIVRDSLRGDLSLRNDEGGVATIRFSVGGTETGDSV